MGAYNCTFSLALHFEIRRPDSAGVDNVFTPITFTPALLFYTPARYSYRYSMGSTHTHTPLSWTLAAFWTLVALWTTAKGCHSRYNLGFHSAAKRVGLYPPLLNCLFLLQHRLLWLSQDLHSEDAAEGQCENLLSRAAIDGQKLLIKLFDF